ncbi:hypothetical protein VCRA2119O147_80024 [Vibrio crassostreae]|nr:hypothetical protein VCRA2113O200_110025 [Vibrio crassostreae]CAK1720066.1 hypothetical protein VCRA2113O218_110131 [Vibrio crassostreae]CAK1727115.1 hypothetical protein VCRA2113O202_120024 [Vibrio crassostreae]CAK1741171.1 hypothetical protein VCRA2119O145_130024 [Vibrio crassostreae]CAK1744356.1 hypothetical protein VCRA2113O194_130025 [Vibrio crassostreae]
MVRIWVFYSRFRIILLHYAIAICNLMIVSGDLGVDDLVSR